MTCTRLVLAISLLSGLAFAQNPAPQMQSHATSTVIDGSKNPVEEKIDPYKARFGRKRPVIAVLSLNSGTEITDFVIPYGILTRSGVADVIAVSTGPGTVKLGPMTIQTQMTTEEFDAKYPEGADYVIVPAVANFADPVLDSWIVEQSRKGDTTMSICIGAIAVANTGLFDGHRATSHYASEDRRAAKFPKVLWEKNIRYVADGRFVSSAGISASIPISIALVEAIAGHDKAAAVAKEVGVSDWSSRHNSDAFQPKPGEPPTIPPADSPMKTIGVPLTPGVDEIALALTVEAYAHTGATRPLLVAAAAAPVKTRGGLLVVPDRVMGGPEPVDELLPPLDPGMFTQALDHALAEIEKNYGKPAASHIAQMMEYPGYQR